MRLSEKPISKWKCGPIEYKPVHEFNTATAEARQDAGRSVNTASGRLANCLTLRYVTLHCLIFSSCSFGCCHVEGKQQTRLFGRLEHRSKVFSTVYPLLWQDRCLCPRLLHKAAVASRLCSCKKLCQKRAASRCRQCARGIAASCIVGRAFIALCEGREVKKSGAG